MKKMFVFCHGFSLTPDYWNSLLPYFSKENIQTWDVYDPKFQYTYLPDFEYIGVGHSLGLIKLLQSPIPWKCLIGLNAFIDFIAEDDNRRQQLIRMQQQFVVKPSLTVKNFHQRCGLPKADVQLPPQLATDLQAMHQVYHLPQSTPCLILGAHDDLVVPPSVVWHNFQNLDNVNYHFFDTGRHSLGFTEVEKITCCINEFVYDYK